MVYRASRPRVAMSFTELRESVLPIFVEMLGKPLHLRKQEELDLVFTEQAEKLSANIDYSYGNGGDSCSVHSSRTESSRMTYGTSRYKDKLCSEDTSDSDTYYTYESNLKKPHKLQPDDQSYGTYDDGPSIVKPFNSGASINKPEPDDQSCLTFDDQGSYYEKSVSNPGKRLDDQSYQGSHYEESVTKSEYYDDNQSYQSNTGSLVKPGKQLEESVTNSEYYDDN